ncbi:MOSC domain-containing protein [Gilliamella sp. B2824]|uniref:YcbX family protein n=1 Tax=Gilliamella sp. B2824 TaxID=2818019 RepID=UPI00226A0903|nr:MOSC N-terminal beta barrel domain-containing protein [Gilliamella sp. B2824]MCX8739677.1 MOSC domain-containing protein [Gilliamella sp. B2824]
MMLVDQLYIYPCKSMKGIPLKKATTTEGGFQYDRVLMISEPDGTFITARQYPQLLKIETTLVDNKIHLLLPSKQAITINLDDFSQDVEPTQVWGNHFTSHIAPISVNQFISQFLQKDVQVRWVGNHLSRRTKRYCDVAVSFADGYPYLLLNQSSFNYLQQQCPEKLDIRQFRGNIIIKDALPFAEDGWKTIKIGPVIFDIVKPCTRCVVTTMNVETSKLSTDNEPLKTLRYFRSDSEGKIDFGMNMIARNHGTVCLDDPIEVLERQPAKNYIKSFPAEIKQNQQPCTIALNEQIIQGNNQQTILEQLEQHQIAVPYSCRAGVCGRCQILLKSGEVTAMTKAAIKRGNRILACSCIPKSNIEIELVKK